jgi:hypothetical protein
LIGSHHYFIYTDPQINPEEMIEWEEAMKEANKAQLEALGGSDAANNEEVQKQLKEMEDKLNADKAAREAEFEEQRKRME